MVWSPLTTWACVSTRMCALARLHDVASQLAGELTVVDDDGAVHDRRLEATRRVPEPVRVGDVVDAGTTVDTEVLRIEDHHVGPETRLQQPAAGDPARCRWHRRHKPDGFLEPP